MKKCIALFVAIIASLSVNAAITEWSCYLSPSSTDIWNGTGYLLEISDNTVNSATISTYLATNGLTGTIAGVKSVSSGVFTDDELYINQSIAENTSATYCVLIVNGQNFAITDDVALTDTSVWTSMYNSASQMNIYSAEYAEIEGAVTALGTAGGNTPGVPEPTALALLALGVAGLALRRKNA